MLPISHPYYYLFLKSIDIYSQYLYSNWERSNSLVTSRQSLAEDPLSDRR